MTIVSIIRGRLLNPRGPGTVDYLPDGAIVGDDRGKIVAVGAWSDISRQFPSWATQVRAVGGWIMPPMLDAHIHIPQHPIRGRFLEGITGSPEGGPLLAGLNRNVFPAEGRCADLRTAEAVIDGFLADTLAHGVIGGAAYQTVHTAATRAALKRLPAEWCVGLVMMERFCPEYLRTDEANLERDVAELAGDFGRRLIVTDRFAGAVDSPLRRRGVTLSERQGLRMQTHLNEQLAEKAWIESLYPQAASYTDVYQRDGLLCRAPILAHCVRMRGSEWQMLEAAVSDGAAVAHCPVSNTLLGSGVMPLDEVMARQIPYCLCTDVGASPTTSLLCEMLQFLKVHRGRSHAATPQEALYRATLAPAEILGLADRLGSFAPGKDLSFIEIAGAGATVFSRSDADQAILEGILGSSDTDLDRYAPYGDFGPAIDKLTAVGLPVADELSALTTDVEQTVAALNRASVRVTLAGRFVWPRS
jgi:guanine deaminase